MVSEYLVNQTIKMFAEIATKLINPEYKLSNGGETRRIISTALLKLEKKYGSISMSRVVDYVVASTYHFRSRGSQWKINQVFGAKSIERFDTDKGKRYYEDRWLKTANITRAQLLKFIQDHSVHPLAKYVYVPSEESTKLRLLNQEVGYVICQANTLGWSPESEACSKCGFVNRCKRETSLKYPEIYRLRIEHEAKNEI